MSLLHATLPLRFAVIGCGSVARSQHIPNIVKSSSMTLHTCVDLDDGVLAECRDVFGASHIRKDFQGAIEDPEVDVICLATTEKLRLPVIGLAAKAEKPVYVEKPLATTLQEMREIRRVVHAANIPFCVGHNRRSSPAMLDAHRIFRRHMTHPAPCPWRWRREGDALPTMADDGGPSVSVRINDDWYSWKSWVFDKTHAPHGPMLFEMTHFTDLCNWFLADEPVEVTAVETGMLNEAVIIRYRSGALATIVVGSNGTLGYCKELYEFMGNGAYLAVDHMLEVRTAGIEDVPAKTTYPMVQDRHPQRSDLGIGAQLNTHRLNRSRADPDRRATPEAALVARRVRIDRTDVVTQPSASTTWRATRLISSASSRFMPSSRGPGTSITVVMTPMSSRCQTAPK